MIRKKKSKNKKYESAIGQAGKRNFNVYGERKRNTQAFKQFLQGIVTSHTTAASVRVRSGLSLSDQSNATLLHSLTKPAQTQSVREMEVLIEWWKRTFTKIMSGGGGAEELRFQGKEGDLKKKKKKIAVAHRPPTQVPDKLHNSISASGRKHNRQECNKIKNKIILINVQMQQNTHTRPHAGPRITLKNTN